MNLQESFYAGSGPEASPDVSGSRGEGALCHTAVVLQRCSGILAWSWGTDYVITFEGWNSAAAAFNSWAAKSFGLSWTYAVTISNGPSETAA